MVRVAFVLTNSFKRSNSDFKSSEQTVPAVLTPMQTQTPPPSCLSRPRFLSTPFLFLVSLRIHLDSDPVLPVPGSLFLLLLTMEFSLILVGKISYSRSEDFSVQSPQELMVFIVLVTTVLMIC